MKVLFEASKNNRRSIYRMKVKKICVLMFVQLYRKNAGNNNICNLKNKQIKMKYLETL